MDKKITLQLPNRDYEYLGFATIAPKDVIIQAYKDKIGQTINYNGEPKLVTDVRVTDEFVFIDLE